MKRRAFLTLLAGGVAIAGPLAAHAQQPAAMPVIGFLSGRSPEPDVPFVAGFRKGLGENGFVEDINVHIDYRWSRNQPDQLPALAADLVRRKPAVISAGGSVAAALAVKRATESIPIVFIIGGDPVKVGLVDSLSQPGGNVTGVSFLATETQSKRLDLLREVVPKATESAVLTNPRNPYSDVMSQDLHAGERAFGLRLRILNASTESEIDAAFASLSQQRPGALLIGADTFFNAMRHKLIAFATRNSIPTIFDVREFAMEGGLMSYGADQTDSYRQAGVYVGRVLKGAKPLDLPVLQPTKFELVINLKTAKALGIEIPSSMLQRADEVIE